MPINDNILADAQMKNEMSDSEFIDLVNTVGNIKNGEIQKCDKLVSVMKDDLNVNSVNSLERSITKFVLYSLAGTGAANIAITIGKAVKYGLKFVPQIVNDSSGSKLSLSVNYFCAFCVMLSFLLFVLYKIYKKLITRSSNNVEDTLSVEETAQYNKLSSDKIYLESQMLYYKIDNVFKYNHITESENHTFTNTILSKAMLICKSVYTWICQKIKTAWEFIKEHKYFFIAIILICGFIFSYFEIRSALEKARARREFLWRISFIIRSAAWYLSTIIATATIGIPIIF